MTLEWLLVNIMPYVYPLFHHCFIDYKAMVGSIYRAWIPVWLESSVLRYLHSHKHKCGNYLTRWFLSLTSQCTISDIRTPLAGHTRRDLLTHWVWSQCCFDLTWHRCRWGEREYPVGKIAKEVVSGMGELMKVLPFENSSAELVVA